MNEEMLDLIQNIEGLGTVGVVLSVIIGILIIICFFYGQIKQWIDLSDAKEYFKKAEDYDNYLAQSGDAKDDDVMTKRNELNESLDDMKRRYSKRGNVHIVLVTLFIVSVIALFGVYSARAYKLDQLNEKLSRIQVDTIEDSGLVANGEFKAEIDNRKVQINMIVRVVNVSGVKLLNAQIIDNVSGAKIQVEPMDANQEKTYTILQNVYDSTKLQLELTDCEFQE